MFIHSLCISWILNIDLACITSPQCICYWHYAVSIDTKQTFLWGRGGAIGQYGGA